jgi:hypothetical protein
MKVWKRIKSSEEMQKYRDIKNLVHFNPMMHKYAETMQEMRPHGAAFDLTNGDFKWRFIPEWLEDLPPLDLHMLGEE